MVLLPLLDVPAHMLPAVPAYLPCLQMVDEDPYQLPTIDESKWFIGGHLGSQIQSVNWQVGSQLGPRPGLQPSILGWRCASPALPCPWLPV